MCHDIHSDYQDKCDLGNTNDYSQSFRYLNSKIGNYEKIKNNKKTCKKWNEGRESYSEQDRCAYIEKLGKDSGSNREGKRLSKNCIHAVILER